MIKRAQWIKDFLSSLSKQPQQQQRLFDELVYGKGGLCILEEQKIIPVTTFLSESVPEILVLAWGNREVNFGFRHTNILPYSYKHQFENNLLPGTYLILRQEHDETTLIFPHPEDRTVFLDLVKFYTEQLHKAPVALDAIILSTFMSVDLNQNMILEEDEVKLLLSKLKISHNDRFQGLLQFIKSDGGDITNPHGVTFTEFERSVKLLQCRMELKGLFERLTWKKIKSFKQYTTRLMPKAAFEKFLKEEQQQSEQRVAQLTQRVFSTDSQISFFEFGQFIMSGDNQIFDSGIQGEQVDESFPLNQYHCLSSHNTYLTGNQLTSDSRTQRYLQDLEQGYRCVEIDVHNGGEGVPIVKHGYTMTSSVKFEAVIMTIGSFCRRHPDHTPIILSVETHTNLEQQLVMAQVLRRHFKDALFTISGGTPQQQFPSLRELRGKIIVKNSGTFDQFLLVEEGGKQSAIRVIEEHSSDGEGQQIAPEFTRTLSDLASVPLDFKQKMVAYQAKREEIQTRKANFMRKQGKLVRAMNINFKAEEDVVKNKKIHPQMLKVTSMLGSGAVGRYCSFESVSLNEKKIKNFYHDNPVKLTRHAENAWVRSYPAAGRMDSSNYNPLPAMQLGVQIIALNSQYPDHFIVMLRNFFRRGKQTITGYRLKQAPQRKPMTLEIRPISASMIAQLEQSQDIPDVEVRMCFMGALADAQKNKNYNSFQAYTEQVKGNGYSPVFSSPRTMQLHITKPQYAFLLIEVPECGINVVALQGIRKGYRVVPLLDSTLRERAGRVLFKIE